MIEILFQAVYSVITTVFRTLQSLIEVQYEFIQLLGLVGKGMLIIGYGYALARLFKYLNEVMTYEAD